MNKKFNLTTLIVAVIIFSATSFYLGMAYEKTKTPDLGANREAMREMMGGGNLANLENLPGRGNLANPENLTGTGMRGGQIIGSILKINNNSLTIGLNNGGSNIVYITEETFIGQMEQIDKNILQEGQEVLIFGANQEGQGIIAESIQIR